MCLKILGGHCCHKLNPPESGQQGYVKQEELDAKMLWLRYMFDGLCEAVQQSLCRQIHLHFCALGKIHLF